MVELLNLDEVVFTAEPHCYFYRKKPYISVSDIIRAVLGDPFEFVPKDRLEHAQSRGNMVHLAASLLVDGELDWSTVDPRIEGYVRAVEKFHKDKPGKVVYREQRLLSPDLGFAGTPDIVMFIDGKRSVVDYKTSQQMNRRMGLQTAGYKILHNAQYPNAPVHVRYGLKLKPDGNYQLVAHEDPDDEIAFEKMRNKALADQDAFQWIQKYK